MTYFSLKFQNLSTFPIFEPIFLQILVKFSFYYIFPISAIDFQIRLICLWPFSICYLSRTWLFCWQDPHLFQVKFWLKLLLLFSFPSLCPNLLQMGFYHKAKICRSCRKMSFWPSSVKYFSYLPNFLRMKSNLSKILSQNCNFSQIEGFWPIFKFITNQVKKFSKAISSRCPLYIWSNL